MAGGMLVVKPLKERQPPPPTQGALLFKGKEASTGLGHINLWYGETHSQLIKAAFLSGGLLFSGLLLDFFLSVQLVFYAFLRTAFGFYFTGRLFFWPFFL